MQKSNTPEWNLAEERVQSGSSVKGRAYPFKSKIGLDDASKRKRRGERKPPDHTRDEEKQRHSNNQPTGRSNAKSTPKGRTAAFANSKQ